MKLIHKKRILALVLPLVMLGIGTIALGVKASLDPKIELPGVAVNQVEYYIDESNFSESLKSGLSEYLLNSDEMGKAGQYYVTSARIEGPWGFVSVSYDLNSSDGLTTYDELIITNEVEKNDWEFANTQTDGFDKMLSAAPEEFVTKEAKSYLMTAQNDTEGEGTKVVELRFPWDKGVEWQWWDRNGNPVWHDCRSINGTYVCAIDMGRQYYPAGTDLRAISSADGTISNVCQGASTVAVEVTHSVNGVNKTFGYYHIDKSTVDLSKISIGRSVTAGQLLGTIYSGSFNDGRCGNASQSSSSAHLHYMLPSAGVSVDDWYFKPYGSCVSNSSNGKKCAGDMFTSTNSVDGCFPPVSGTWTITGECTVSNSVSAPGSIIVKPSGSLTVKSSGKIDMNLNAYKLSVENGGRVQIENNAKIY